MRLVADPIWPWSDLWTFLASASGGVRAAVALAGLLVLVLPILVRVRPGGRSPRQLLQGGAVALLTLLGVVALGSTGSSSSLVVGLGNAALVLLLVVPLGLIGMTGWAYLGVQGATPRRVGAVLVLRLLAFALALVAVLQPAVAFSDKDKTPTRLWIAVDGSKSMSIRDEADDRSRWEQVLHVLKETDPVLGRLRAEHNVEVRFFRFGADVAELDPETPGKADGARTDIAYLLHHLYDLREAGRPPGRLLLLSDGAHNGVGRTPPRSEADRWRKVSCPVETFACGSDSTSSNQSDIALRTITVSPDLVPAKGKMTVKLTLDYPGFEGSEVRLRLFLDGKEAAARNVTLGEEPIGNRVTLTCDAPPKAGEYRVAVRVEDLHREGHEPAGDKLPSNNQIETFATVTKEGISVLLVDRQRAFEPQMICDALEGEPRIRVHKVWLRGSKPLEGGREDLFQLDDKQYDVILLGDVSAEQIQRVREGAAEAMARLVDNGTGLMMLGGYASFGNGNWQGTALGKLLPLDLGQSRGQDDREVRMLPTDAGMRKLGYVLRLTDEEDPRAAWERLPPLEGRSRLVRSGVGLDSVLAVTPEGEPLLIAQERGGRILAFGGDTTHRWVNDEEGQKLFERFWRRMVIWLARQEDAEGSIWVKPETRRLPVGAELLFQVGARNKDGVSLKGGTFRAEVVGPKGQRHPVAIARLGTEERGVFVPQDGAGEYRIEVQGEVRDRSETVRGETKARLIVHDENPEMREWAADPVFLKDLARAGGGQAHALKDLPAYLEGLPAQLEAQARWKQELWPTWQTKHYAPFLPWFFGLFVLLLASEWLLRRRWGMV